MSLSSLTHEVEWLWTWGGESFGYRNQDALYSHEGTQIGRFAEGDEIYGQEGNYLGEIRTTGRLITNLSKNKWRRQSFLPRAGRGFEQKTDAIAKDIPEGFKDFPAATRFV